MQALILCGGDGTRLSPLTKSKPKCLFPLPKETVVDRLIRQCKSAGIEDIVVVAGKEIEVIKEHMKEEKGVEVIPQIEGCGTAKAVASAEGVISGDAIILPGDSVYDDSLIKSVVDETKKNGSGFIVGAESEHPEMYGVIIEKDGIVERIDEKPENPKSSKVNITVISADAEFIKKAKMVAKNDSGEHYLTDILNGFRIMDYNGYWKDMGTYWTYLDAVKHTLGEMEGNVKMDGAKVYMEEDAEVGDVFFEGNIYIGKGCKVGPNSYLRGDVLLWNGCEIGFGTTVKSSVLFDKVKAKHLNYIGDSIIGERVNFGAGTQIANYRFDGGEVKVKLKGKKIGAGRRKFGAVVGPDTKFGVLSSVMPGKIIGKGCWVGANVCVSENLGDGKKIFINNKSYIVE